MPEKIQKNVPEVYQFAPLDEYSRAKDCRFASLTWIFYVLISLIGKTIRFEPDGWENFEQIERRRQNSDLRFLAQPDFSGDLLFPQSRHCRDHFAKLRRRIYRAFYPAFRLRRGARIIDARRRRRARQLDSHDEKRFAHRLYASMVRKVRDTSPKPARFCWRKKPEIR